MAGEDGELVGVRLRWVMRRFLSGAVAPQSGLSGVVVFVHEGDAKLRAVGGDFADVSFSLRATTWI